MNCKTVLIGASAGGPGHLRKILSSLDKNIKFSIVIAQHMNNNLIPSFVTQMQENCSVPVLLADNKMKIKKGNIYICAHSMEFILQNNQTYLMKSEKEDIYSPSINILFDSAKILLSQTDLTAVLLTGIGDDGARAMLELYKNGVNCIAESEASAIVYGMPKQAYEMNKQLYVMNLYQIVEFIQNV